MTRWLGAPVHVVHDGARLGLRRVWPREHGVLHLEYAADDGRVGAQLRPGEGGSRFVVHRGGADRRLPGLAGLVSLPGARVVCHVPERRGVVRLEDGSYARALRRGRSGPVVASVERARAASLDTFAVPLLRTYDVETDVTVWAPLPGPTLLALGAARPAAALLADAWRSAGRAVRVLHDGDPEGLPHHGPLEEVGVARRWLSAAAEWGLLPSRGEHPAYDELLRGEPGPPGVLHRDLHDKQVLVGSRPGLLDLDTLSVGERALDLGNVLAHLDLRCAQGLLDARSAALAADAFLAGVSPDAATTRRIAAHRTVSRLRLAGLYAFRPRWSWLARSWDRDLWGDVVDDDGPPHLSC